MMRALLVFLLSAAGAWAAIGDPKVCAGGVAAVKLRLEVARPDRADRMPLAQVSRAEKSWTVRYQPTELPPDFRNNGRVALAVSAASKAEDSSALRILEMKPAAGVAEWTLPFRTGMVVFLFGPQGLDEKRVNTAIAKDDALLDALADYAEQTEEIESTIEALMDSGGQEEESSDGFVRLARGTPSEQALYALLRGLSPVMTGASPLGAGRRVGPVTTMNKASVGFFENAGSIMPGGGALSEIKPFLFPDTEFRAAFLERAAGGGQAMCSSRVAKTRNRQVFLWARRVPNAEAPAYTIVPGQYSPIGSKGLAAVKVQRAGDWTQADRLADWRAIPAQGGTSLAVPVRPSPAGRSFELDLRRFVGAAGEYKLEARWDWDRIALSGTLHLEPLGEVKQARVEGLLVEGTGFKRIALTGADFQFVERVELQREGWNEPGREIAYSLAQGRRRGRQERMEIEIDLDRLRAGAYHLTFTQTGDRSESAPARVLTRQEAQAAAPKLVARIGKILTPADLGVGLADGELPTDSVSSVSITTEGRERPSGVELGCQDQSNSLGTLRLKTGARERGASLTQAGEQELFLTFEPGLIGTAGCTLMVVVEAGEARSEPLTAGRLVRLPRIERLELTDDRLAGGNYAGLLRGWNLETIAKVGWDASNGAAVEQPPLPMAGERGKQELRTGIPWPSPTPRARLFVWLRGDSAGRATSTRP